MRKHTKLLGTACILAMGIAAPAMAGAPVGFAGTIGGGYTYSSSECSGCGHSDNWNVNGQAAFGFGASDVAGELDAGWINSSPSGASGSLNT